MTNVEDRAIPRGSTVLVTGVNGFIASHVADQFIQQGYKVRGTVRDAKKNAWLNTYFDTTYGKGHFELVSVPDMMVEDAFEEAVRGVTAFVHVASVVNLNPDASKVIPAAVTATEVAIKAAFRESSVKRFVLTSSSFAAVPSGPFQEPFMGSKGVPIAEESWNSQTVDLAWKAGPWGPEHGGIVYMASKVEQERAAWKYYKENQTRRPDLVVNTVLPDFNIGKSLDPVNQGYPSTSGLIRSFMNGNRTPLGLSLPQCFIDVQDDALLHVAAAILPDVKGERVFGFAESFNYDRILDILRRQNPGRKFHENYSDGEYPFVIKPRGRAEELLRRLGKSGWTSLEESLLLNTKDAE
ncbi:aldehyde reductase [Colletotrichum truncatum]|uniref:Aldehyde reductase n=1 Tax=Colletotrichum truncatum TaxID=5467 RepID=A0ACC3Z308_COLTU|nr:aldehyde reductase [Colletotrichum truncatum]KAF6793209.1 aldehyde reductase [Colletotrichum truncatum]